MKGHPVFIAQHATATCCRKCIQKWHGIEKGRALNDAEVQYILALIMGWIGDQLYKIDVSVKQNLQTKDSVSLLLYGLSC